MEITPQLKPGEKELQKPVQSAEKEYSDLIDLALHELDAPFRKLNILLERVSDKFETVSGNEELQMYITRINSSIHGIRKMIDDLSILAAIGTEKSHYVSCDIESIVCSLVNEIAGEKKPKTAFESLPVIGGDKMQLTLLFKCLLDNIIKFSKENVQPEIGIRSAVLTGDEKDYLKIEKDKIYFKIRITDRGIGFDNKYAERIFRPFVQLHGKSQFPGSGIGLAMARKIAELHGGLIFAEGNENGGACFTLILPETH